MAVITVSRLFGSGGRTLAEKISRRLGYALFDNELIQRVADSAKVSSDSVAFLEKDTSGIFRRFVGGIVPKTLGEILSERKGESIEESVYVDLLSRIIKEIAQEGNAVIIGRASQYILRDFTNAFHVLIRAELRDRVAFLQKHYDLTPDEARRAVDQEDRRRTNLYRRFRKSDYDSPVLYHLVLNTSRIDLDVACRLVCSLAAERPTRAA